MNVEELFENKNHHTSTCRTMERAWKQRWPISDSDKIKIIEKLKQVLENKTDIRASNAAASALIRIEESNQLDDLTAARIQADADKPPVVVNINQKLSPEEQATIDGIVSRQFPELDGGKTNG